MGRPAKNQSPTRSRFGNVRKHIRKGEWTGGYQARYTYKGESNSKLFGTHKEASQWLANEEVRNGTTGYVKRELRQTTFEQAGREWLEAHIHVSLGQQVENKRIFERDLVPEFGKLAVSEIEVADVRRFVNKELKFNAPKTADNKRTVLRSIFKFAIQEKYLVGTNPCEFVRIPMSADAEMLFLTHEEVLRLAMAMGTDGLPVKLSAYAGLRAGEMWDAKVSALNPNKGRISVETSVRQVKGHGYLSGTTKTKKKRSVPVPFELMKELVILCQGKSMNDYIFSSPNGKQVRHNNWYRRTWIPGIEASGIDKKPRIHDLRHTCAAFYFQNGASSEEVKQILGHTTINTTHKHYAHVFPEAFSRSAAGIDESIRRAAAAMELSVAAEPVPFLVPHVPGTQVAR